MTNATQNTAAPSKKSASKYTPAMEARMREEAPLNAEKAAQLAAEFGNGITAKGVIAKASRDGIPYERKVATTKTGGKIESKEAIVKQMAAIIGDQLDGLDKATKPTLQVLRDFVVAAEAEREAA